MRGKLIVLGVVVALASATFVAQASGGLGGGRSTINCQSSAWETMPVSSVPQFRHVGGLAASVTAIYPVTVTVSGVLRGKPSNFKVVDKWVGGKDTAAPGVIKVTPVHGRATPFSFTWVASGSSASEHGHQIFVSWRRATSTGISTLLKADVTITYTWGGCTGGGS
jgi:hypothetical protein